MARGWESKSVESQQADAAPSGKQDPAATGPDPATLELIRKKETVLLSRTRILREIETSRNPRYREILHHALSDLDAQLNELTERCASRSAAARAS